MSLVALVRFVIIRLLAAIPTLFVVATLTFGLIQLIPGSPAEFILGSSATPDQVAALNAKLGLDQPLWQQYTSWLAGAVHGDFGTSITSNQPAGSLVLRALPVTLSVAALGLAFTMILGLALGLLAAVRGGRLDAAVQYVGSLAMAIPGFWLASLLVYAFAIRTRIFYATDYTPFLQGPWQWALHVTLPALAVAVASTGQVVFQARAAFGEELGRDYLRTLTAGGIPRRTLLLKHVLRNGLTPVMAFLGMMFVFMLGGVVIIESIFALPGLGSLMLRSVNNHDLALVQACVVAFTVLVVLVNLVVDLLVGLLDPRARLS